MNTTITVKRCLLLFIIVLFISGLTVLPAELELKTGMSMVPVGSVVYNWLDKLLDAYRNVALTKNFLLYGYDWLAFAHFVLAILFIGPYKDPVKNIWVIEFGMIASLLILPFAFIAGSVRDIPVWWRLVDCSFGVFGFLLLWYCYKKINTIIQHQKETI
jgi:hypothetical protein